uniref:Uncharacterized protein n=1 Tax=Avena sativa TaxID=4498 RepID=A0ACD5Z1I4_AVESA
MAPRSEHAAGSAAAASAAAQAESDSMDPLFHVLRVVPFSFLQPPRTRLKLPSNLALPSPMTVFALILLTYFAVVSGLVYDVIVDPPGIGSTQDPATGAVRPVVFLPGRVNGQYIIEGLSSGFMFLLGGVGIILLDLAVDRTRPRSLRISFGGTGVAAIVIAYAMAMLFLRIKIPGYLCKNSSEGEIVAGRQFVWFSFSRPCLVSSQLSVTFSFLYILLGVSATSN